MDIEKLEVLMVYLGALTLMIIITFIVIALAQLISYRIFGFNLYKKIMHWIEKEINND